MSLLFKSDPPHVERRVFRFRRSQYTSRREIVTKESWTRMVKLSCKCDACQFFGPDTDANEGDVDIRCDKPVSGGLYNAVMIPDGIDFDSGCVDGWHWKMKPIPTDGTSP